jgi:hypothetical protein
VHGETPVEVNDLRSAFVIVFLVLFSVIFASVVGLTPPFSDIP